MGFDNATLLILGINMLRTFSLGYFQDIGVLYNTTNLGHTNL
jgi:hypothetical protein